jgi:hypothetical protein
MANITKDDWEYLDLEALREHLADLQNYIKMLERGEIK